MLEHTQGTYWFSSYAKKLAAIAFPIAFVLSIIPLVLGLFIPQMALVYLISAYLVTFLTIFGVCFILFGFRNRIARRLIIIVAAMSLLGALSQFWLLIETLFLGFPIMYPTGSAYLAASANIVMLVGFVLVSIEQRRQSWRQIGGYLLILLLFLVCILGTYQVNLTFNPPIIPAIGSGLRILAGFFTAIFAWTFYFNQDPSEDIIGRFSRLIFVIASLALFLGYTVFAIQYASNFLTIPAFYYAGSLSDTINLFSIFTFLIAVSAIFSESLEKMATVRAVSIRYEIITRVLLILTVASILTLISIIAITLTGRVLLVFLPAAEGTLALQTISLGLLMGLMVIFVIGGCIAYYLSRLLYRPLERLAGETAAVTEPGRVSYVEPPGLLFSELQSVSDSYATLIEELSRVRAELRRHTITTHQQKMPTHSQLARLDYYLAILTNILTNRTQSILSLTELGATTSNQEDQNRLFKMIQGEVGEIHELVRDIQLLRLIDIQALPEFSRIDLCPIITKLISDLQEIFPESNTHISLSLPEHQCQVLANDFVSQIFHPLLRLVLEQDVGGSAIIEVTFSKIIEFEVEYWQINITHPKWVLPDIEKILLFRSDPEQPQRANPSLLVVPALVEYFSGKFRVKNIVIDDPRYGTVFQVLLPIAKSGRSRRNSAGSKSK